MTQTPPNQKPRRRLRGLVAILLVAALIAAGGATLLAPFLRPQPPRGFAALRDGDDAVADAGFAEIERGWRPESAAMTLEVMPMLLHFGHRERLFDLLRRKTGQTFANGDTDGWYRWVWTQPPPDAAVLNQWRYEFYSSNNGFPLGTLAGYFADAPTTLVRADEIRWGGVLRDGVPPIRETKMIPAAAATYLDDTNVVYGVRINGDARAYPRRVLGHHEMVIDTVGGEPMTGVYCTLCETMIAYHSRTPDGAVHAFGTSGFLYRSNKLMYDAATLSLWSTVSGKPVVGKLAGSGVKLAVSPVVTTTWGEWRTRHSDTRVLSHRDLPEVFPEVVFEYPEGSAYRAYNATDKLMFATPSTDTQLKNKDQVFVPRLPEGHKPVAVSAAFLIDHPVFSLTVGGTNLLIVTTPKGANRAYAVGPRKFEGPLVDDHLTDASGTRWKLTEESLSADGQAPLPRVPGHRAFWFGWHAAHPDTELIK